MSVVLQAPVRAGTHVVAALARRSVHAGHGRHGIAAMASQHPVALLIADGRGVQAFGPAGEPMTPDAVERLCPGAIATLLDLRPPGPPSPAGRGTAR